MSSTPDLRKLLTQPSPLAAPLLLGQRLVRELPEGRITAIISEVEAYQEGDPASHTFNGKTARTKAMFGPPGHAYIYFTYGMHWCFNIVADRDGAGSGVLIRAIEIEEGYDLAARNRYDVLSVDQLTRHQRNNISNGPGKLAQALRINKGLYEIDLLHPSSELRLEPGTYNSVRKIIQTPRIGISKAVDVPWRWLLE